MFAVGLDGVVLHYDGKSWREMKTPTRALLLDIWGSGADDVFAVGLDGTMWHYRGESWRQERGGGTHWDVWGSSREDIFVLDIGGGGLHYDGQSWSEMETFASMELVSIWGSGPRDVFAVGNVGEIGGGVVLHYDGESWSQMEIPTSALLAGIWGSGPQDVFAVGESPHFVGTILHYDGESWRGVTSHSLEMALRLVKMDFVSTIQFPFSFIEEAAAAELHPAARAANVGIMAMKPFCGGLVDNAGVAFAYLRQYPDIIPLPGWDTVAGVDELRDVYEQENEVTPEDLAEMARYREELGDKFCRRCEYCQPCPQGG